MCSGWKPFCWSPDRAMYGPAILKYCYEEKSHKGFSKRRRWEWKRQDGNAWIPTDVENEQGLDFILNEANEQKSLLELVYTISLVVCSWNDMVDHVWCSQGRKSGRWKRLNEQLGCQLTKNAQLQTTTLRKSKNIVEYSSRIFGLVSKIKNDREVVSEVKQKWALSRGLERTTILQ